MNATYCYHVILSLLLFLTIWNGMVVISTTTNCENIQANKILSAANNILEERNTIIELNDNQLPITTISYAQTLDGSIAPANRTRWNLSSKISFHLLHSLRARHDGLLVGIKTLIVDQPQLNIRDQLYGQEIEFAQTRPIIIDSNLSILNLNPKSIRIKRPIVCCCRQSTDPVFILAQTKLAEIGGSVICCESNDQNRCCLKDAFKKLKNIYGIRTILVEGGAEIIQSVLQERLCDQIVLTLKPYYLGGYRSLRSQLEGGPVMLSDVTTVRVEEDIIIHGIIHKNK